MLERIGIALESFTFDILEMGNDSHALSRRCQGYGRI